MQKDGRIVRTGTNLITAVLYQIIKVVMSFAGRTVFIYTLGKEYLGVEGLFTSVLSILNISELGIGAGIIYCLYSPLAENDTPKIQAYMKFYRMAYRIIGCVIAIIGLILLPYINFFIEGNTELINIELLYLLYLFQSVSSYLFFAYKSSIITADQKNSSISMIQSIMVPVITFFQVIELLVFKSFIAYVCIGILGNILCNFFVARKAGKMYPEIWKKNNSKLTKEEKHELGKKIRGLAMYKFSGTVLTSTDNLIIVKFLGTAVLGIYSNYILLFNYVSMIPSMLFNSLLASLGNANAVESIEKKEKIYNKISFLIFWIYCVLGICLLCLVNPFIENIWLNKSFLLNKTVLWLLFCNFITVGLQQTIIAYKDACGLFWEGRWRPVVSGGLNLLISLILVKSYGIEGVILGTIISRFLTTWWFDPWLVYRKVFHKSSLVYYKTYIIRLCFVFVIAGITIMLNGLVRGTTVISFITKCIISCITPNVCLWIVFRKKEEFMYFKELMHRFYNKVK